MARNHRETQFAPARLAQQHARDLIESLGRLYRTPVASLLTACVIGITLALPGGLVLGTQVGWNGSTSADATSFSQS